MKKTFRHVLRRSQTSISIDIQVLAGEIHGLVGPNGAGKTTFLRMLTGLVRPDSGTISVFGVDVRHDLPRIMRRAGVLIEDPRLVPTLTARATLEILARMGDVPVSRVATVIELVGMSDFADEVFGKYSFGMKQWAGLAAALLRGPDLLILDEPTNGLDADGVLELRVLLTELASEGRTILVSSHALDEFDRLADSVTIISAGKSLITAPLVDLRRLGSPRVTILADDPDRAAAHLTARGRVVERSGAVLLVVDATADDVPEMIAVLTRGDVAISAISPSQGRLEDVYNRVLHGGRA